jgi:AcrR family transcriptional regulator
MSAKTRPEPATEADKPSPDGKSVPPRQRLPAGERRAEMLARAARHFAEHGFHSSTRDIATALGVTQALIYKHFASKDDLVEQTLQAALGGAQSGSSWLDPGLPVRAALLAYYTDFVAGSTEARMRLFIRAGLDGRSWPTRRGHALTRNLFLPAIAGLRAEAGLPGTDAVAPMRGERELVMMLHASMVFLGIRRHVYGMPMPERLDDVVGLYVETFMAGAIPALRALHAGGAASLKVPLAARSRGRGTAPVSAPGRKRTSRT